MSLAMPHSKIFFQEFSYVFAPADKDAMEPRAVKVIIPIDRFEAMIKEIEDDDPTDNES